MTDESLEEMKRSIHDDEILQQLKAVIQTGWPEDKHLLPVVLVPYFSYRDELSVCDGLVFNGERLIIPQKMRQKIIERLHSSHIGINGCLRRAGECIFWLCMSAGLRQHISEC